MIWAKPPTKTPIPMIIVLSGNNPALWKFSRMVVMPNPSRPRGAGFAVPVFGDAPAGVEIRVAVRMCADTIAGNGSLQWAFNGRKRLRSSAQGRAEHNG